MPIDNIWVHKATPVSLNKTGGWVEGEFIQEPAEGVPFDCCLFLPQGTESSDGRGRKVREPTLLYAPEDDALAPTALNPDHELLIVAPELNAAEGRPADTAVRWMVVGAPQPFGKPGADVIGFQATLRRIDD